MASKNNENKSHFLKHLEIFYSKKNLNIVNFNLQYKSNLRYREKALKEFSEIVACYAFKNLLIFIKYVFIPTNLPLF